MIRLHQSMPRLVVADVHLRRADVVVVVDPHRHISRRLPLAVRQRHSSAGFHCGRRLVARIGDQVLLLDTIALALSSQVLIVPAGDLSPGDVLLS